MVKKPFEKQRTLALQDLPNCVIDLDNVEKLKLATPEDKASQPVIVNQNGIIINGANRLYADNNWDILPRQMSNEEALVQRYKEEIQTKSPEKRRESLKNTIGRLQKAYRDPRYRTELQRWAKEYSKSLGTSTTARTFKVGNLTILGFRSLNQAVNTKISKELGIGLRYQRKLTSRQFKQTEKTHKNKPMRNSSSSSQKTLKDSYTTSIKCPFCKECIELIHDGTWLKLKNQ
jgi:hypothetical protein